MPAHWWVELGLCPLVGRTQSRTMSKGGCGLMKSLGSLSTDGWSCFRTHLVVWPEAFQHWGLQAVGWGQILVLMSQCVGCQDCSCI